MTSPNSIAITTDVLGLRRRKLTEAGQSAVLEYLDQNLTTFHGEGMPIVTVLSEDGSQFTPYEFFDIWLDRHPDHIASTKPTTKTPESRTMTEQAIATTAARKGRSQRES